MSTKGLVTVVYKGDTKVAQYNSHDSKPLHFGKDILKFLIYLQNTTRVKLLFLGNNLDK